MKSPFATVRSRIRLGTLALAIVPLVLATVATVAIALNNARDSLHQRAEEHLVSLREVKQAEITDYFDHLRANLLVLARTDTIVRAARELPAPFHAAVTPEAAAAARAALERYYTGDFLQEYQRKNPGASVDMRPILQQLSPQSLLLQHRYVAANPHPLGSKGNLDDAGDGGPYSALHRELHPLGRSAVLEYGLYDMFIVNVKDGAVLYTYFKELDFSTSLLTGPYAKTKLGEAFRAVREADAGTVYLSDYDRYLPSYDDQAAFLGTPLFDGNERVGVLLVQVPIDRINRVMTFSGKWSSSGMGASGETYLATVDGQARSVSRFLLEDKDAYLAQIAAQGTDEATRKTIVVRNSNVGLQRFVTEGVRAAAGGRAGFGIYPDYRGVPVLGAFAPLDVLGLKWLLLAEIDEAEAFAPVGELARQTLLAGAAIAVLALGVAAFLSTRLAGSVNRPIAALQGVVQRLNDGDFAARAKLIGADELAQLGGALDKMLDERVSTLASAQRENESLNNSVVEIMQAVSRLASRDLTIKVPVTGDVTGAISDALNLMISETATVLRQVIGISAKVAEASARLREQSGATMSLAENGSREITAASTELDAAAEALRQIAQRARLADASAEEAIAATRQALANVQETVGGIGLSRDLVRETEKRVKRLGERSQEITAVVDVIGDIAERTSILAINTSMQAVAAGEAGRAYAVVADEVKRLAEGARSATQQVSALVGAVRAETVETVDSINKAITHIVDTSRVAERAGEAMRSTQKKTDQLATSVRDIYATTEAQSRASDTLKRRASQIQQATQSTTQQMRHQAAETQQLASYAENLLGSVRAFTLPA